jgi:PAS domain S-box-containing protein
LNSDGHTAVRNRAADVLLERISAGPNRGEDEAAEIGASSKTPAGSSDTPSEGEIDTAWLLSHFNCYDATFSHLLHFRDYPLYRCAILGQKIVSERIGAISKDGSKYTLDVTGIPLFDSQGDGSYIGGVLFLKDVTMETFSASSMGLEEGALVEDRGSVDSIGSFKRVCEDLPEIAWIANRDGYLEWYNHRWYEYTGSTFETSKGSSWTDYVHPSDLPSVGKAWSKALRQESRYEVQERILAKDGSYKWMLCRAHPVRNSEGKILRWFGMLTGKFS